MGVEAYKSVKLGIFCEDIEVIVGAEEQVKLEYVDASFVGCGRLPWYSSKSHVPVMSRNRSVAGHIELAYGTIRKLPSMII